MIPDPEISPLWSNRQGEIIYWSKGAVWWTGPKWVQLDNGLSARVDAEGNTIGVEDGDWQPWIPQEVMNYEPVA